MRSSARLKRTMFATLAAGSLLAASGYVAWAAVRDRTPSAAASPSSARQVLSGTEPAILFRSVARDGTYGQVGAARLADPRSGVLTGLVCDRVHFAAQRGLCIGPSALGTAATARLFGPDLRPRREISLGGLPSRARVSPDGRYAAATTFVSGHSYADQGTFSTATVLIDLVRGRVLANLEEFAITRDGKRIRSEDVNFWGVTFAGGGDRFYATLATGGQTYLIEARVSSRRGRVLRANVECPSLSPDGTRIAFKKRVGGPGEWRLHVLDLATMAETPLGEERSVDDQAEWLDGERIAYGREGHIWVVQADGSGKPRLLLPDSSSPVAVRRGPASPPAR